MHQNLAIILQQLIYGKNSFYSIGHWSKSWDDITDGPTHTPTHPAFLLAKAPACCTAIWSLFCSGVIIAATCFNESASSFEAVKVISDWSIRGRFVKWLLSRNVLILISVQLPVWPDLANFRHFGNIFWIFVKWFRVYLVFGNFFDWIWLKL